MDTIFAHVGGSGHVDSRKKVQAEKETNWKAN